MSTKPSTSQSASSVITRKSIENLHSIDLIGNTSHQIVGAKLPSIRQVLQVMFFNMRFVHLKAREAAKLAIDSAKIFWQQARLPIRTDQRIIDQLLRIYEDWKAIQKKPAEKRSTAQKKSADTLVESLDDLFDMATSNA